MPHTDPLKRSVWNALTTRLHDKTIGNHRALRLAPEYGVFAAAANASPESLDALAALVLPGQETWLYEQAPVPPIPGTRVLRAAPCVQMVLRTAPPPPPGLAFTALTEEDAPAMRTLVALTHPGPFSTATHRLGRFIGVKQAGTLVAMAGERLQPPGHTEISGVCTHPDHRGRGYAGALMTEVARGIIARGETPFLQAYAANTGAIALYTRLGFTLHAEALATVLVRDGGAEEQAAEAAQGRRF